MSEKCGIYNLESFTDEERQRVEDLIKQIENEKKSTKWWVMPKYSVFSDGLNYNKFGPCYQIEPQEDSYSKSRPPLKTGFNSKEEAETWLDNYLREDDLFLKAKDEINKLNCNLGHILKKFNRHEYVTSTDWHDCFESFNASKNYGAIKEVTKE